jgi:TolB protein
MKRLGMAVGFVVLAWVAASAMAQQAPLGMFEGHGDVGSVLHVGTLEADSGGRSYSLVGSGENMWAIKDAFHFAWKKASGDLSLTSDVSFVGQGVDPHRKACLMIRQGLEADSVYVDVALHGDGLTSLQFREAAGAATHEVQANVTGPRRLKIEKRGPYVRMYLASGSGDPSYSGAAVLITLKDPFYIGLAVCSHNKDVTEKATFSDVELVSPLPEPSGKPMLYSALETQSMASTDRRVVHITPTRIEAPNWLRDGRTLLYNSGGRLYRIPSIGGQPEAVDTGFATRCNNDHGVSPDGTLLAISDQSQGSRQSLIYTLPVGGGTPKLITPVGPSYWHGWSPDGKTLAYCARRDGEFDIYTVPAEGGSETRLTTSKGLDDGPEYSPDGKSIYFNSDRTGTMQVWKMNADGTSQEQVTADEFNNWFPHPSPDGKKIVFIAFEKDVVGHPENKDVTLKVMTLETKKVEVLGKFFGGQGTVNVPCWSPDGKKIAFVTYQLVP